MHEPWNTQQAASLYAMEQWSDGFFGVNPKGQVVAYPTGDKSLEVALPAVIEASRAAGSTLPLLIRFQDILRTRVRRLNEAFRQAIAAHDYPERYRAIFPIKVNQLHEVVAEVLAAGADYQLGLESGSKAELIAALSLASDERLMLCNGVKDASMLQLMLNAQALGQDVLPVMEKYSEFEHLLNLADAMPATPVMGVRIKLSTRGSGRWFESGGSKSKFGLTIAELVQMTRVLTARNQKASLRLLHFHVGSQIADIRVLRQAVSEITQIYCDLRQRGFNIEFVDIGGGLGVDYGGEPTDGDANTNYTLEEYANAVVETVSNTCRERDVAPPTLLSESGRAMTAHHSLLVVPVLGVTRTDRSPIEPPADLTEAHVVVQRLQAALNQVGDADSVDRVVAAVHTAQAARAEADQLARLGYLDIEQVAIADTLYLRLCRAALARLQAADVDPAPAELELLETQLTDLYLCNFSLFHSLIDHWAIEQVFPVMPLSQLTEEPGRRGVLVDLTCDSDGKIGSYVTENGSQSWLPVHELNPDQPYYLGIFLVGAYQEIMGDAHNLIGRVAEVHVYADASEPDNFYIEEQIPAIAVGEMLSQVQYFTNDLDRRMTELVKRRIEAGAVKPTVGMRMLDQYTTVFKDTTYCSS